MRHLKKLMLLLLIMSESGHALSKKTKGTYETEAKTLDSSASNSSSNSSNNSAAPSCDPVIKACDKAIKALQRENDLLQELRTLDKKGIEARDEEIARVRKKYDERISPLVWIGAGILAGAAGAIYLNNR